MTQKIKYKIVRGSEVDNVCRMIENEANKGWQLQGGICHSFGPVGYSFYCQALTKTVSLPTEDKQ